MRKWLGNRLGIAVIAVSLMVSTTGFAHGGGGGHGGGGWHGGGGGWHGGGGGWHGGGGGWHGGGWHGGGWGGGWGVWGPGVVVTSPYYDYGPSCQTVRVCNNYGHCWLQESCY